MTRRPRPSKYHRSQLGGGNTLKAVTRARRSAPSRLICHVDGVKPPVWRAALRKQREAAAEHSRLSQEIEMSARPAMWEASDLIGGHADAEDEAA